MNTSSPPESPKYTHAVAHDVWMHNPNEKPKRTDHLEYCISEEHAHAIAMQFMASGATNVAIIVLKDPVDVNSV